jgi:hypothetical protein
LFLQLLRDGAGIPNLKLTCVFGSIPYLQNIAPREVNLDVFGIKLVVKGERQKIYLVITNHLDPRELK